MTARPASLAMYDGAGLRRANDALWRAIAQRLRAAGVEHVPVGLDRSRAPDDLWNDPDLLLAQTCGYPLMTGWRGRLQYVATPRYRAAGCEGAFYRSRFLVRADEPGDKLADFRDRRAVVNQWTSNSGMNMLRGAIAPLAQGEAFFASVAESGSHAASIGRLLAGTADIAAIDTVTFALLRRRTRGLDRRLRTLGWSDAVPGLPLVTAAATSDRELRLLREALDDVMRTPSLRTACDTLLLDGFEQLPMAAYQQILRIERAAVRAGYPVLR